VLILTLIVSVRISKVGARALFRGLKPVLFIIAFTAVLNLFYTPGTVIAQFWIFHVTREGVITAIAMMLRISLLIMGTFLLTYTTSPIRLTDGLEDLLGPLKKLGVPVHELAMMMSIALRFIPTLIEETDKIMSAQRARGADFESGNLRRQTFLLKKSFFDIRSNMAQDFEDEISLAEEDQKAAAEKAAMAYHKIRSGDTLGAIALATDVGYLGMLFGYLLLFVVGGYLLYSAMFAAVGSAVDNAQDAAQLQTPIMIPIILAVIVEMSVLNDPNSPLAFWFSLIPFTSPVVMMARIPYGIPTWEIVLSLVLLYAAFVGMVWLSAKIYRVGIFMYGKKPTLREMFRWIRYKY